MNRLYPILLLISWCATAYGQVLTGIYTPTDNTDRIVLSKSRYKLKPVMNEVSLPQLTFFERFDNKGRIIEEKDINLDGTMYAWSFLSYDKNGNKVRRRVLNGDSSLMYVQSLKYDDRNRLVFSIGVEPDKNIRFQSSWLFKKDSTIYYGFIGDSSNLSTYIDKLDSNGRIILQVRYNGYGDKKEKVYDAYLTYQDTVLLKKVESYYEKGKLDRGAKLEYDLLGNITKEISIDSDGSSHLKKLNKYDSLGNLIYDKGFRNNKVNYVFRWEHEYDSLNRIIQTIKYCDTLQFRAKKTQLRSKTTFEYRENFLLGLTRIKTEYRYWGLLLDFIPIEKVTTVYDDQNLWINTTETQDGELIKYRFTVYTFSQ